jgi:hypothetical protein
LYPENTQQAISEGVDLMLRTGIKLLGKQKLMLAYGQDTADKPDDCEDDAEAT